MKERRQAPVGILRLVTPVSVIMLLACAPAIAHGPLHERLSALSEAIAAAPGDGTLYAARAALHLEHGDFDAANQDLERARELGARRGDLALLKTRILIRQMALDDALLNIDRYCASAPDDPQAHIARADVLVLMKRTREAGQALAEAIRLTPVPNAELYLRRSQLLEQHGDQGAARDCLAAAYAAIPDSEVLRNALCESMIRAGDLEQALALLDRIVAQASRKERWLARKAEVLLTLDRRPDALAAARAALAAIRELPVRHRRVPAMRDLAAQIRERFPELD